MLRHLFLIRHTLSYSFNAIHVPHTMNIMQARATEIERHFFRLHDGVRMMDRKQGTHFSLWGKNTGKANLTHPYLE